MILDLDSTVILLAIIFISMLIVPIFAHPSQDALIAAILIAMSIGTVCLIFGEFWLWVILWFIAFMQLFLTPEREKELMIEILWSLLFMAMVIGTLSLILQAYQLAIVFWFEVFVLMFFAKAMVGGDKRDDRRDRYEDAGSVYEARDHVCDCGGTGLCQQCRGTGGTGWSGTRVMLPKSRCPICLGSGACAKCRGTSSRGHW